MQEKKIGCRGSVRGEGGADDETEQTRKREISILKWVGVLIQQGGRVIRVVFQKLTLTASGKWAGGNKVDVVSPVRGLLKRK